MVNQVKVRTIASCPKRVTLMEKFSWMSFHGAFYDTTNIHDGSDKNLGHIIDFEHTSFFCEKPRRYL